MSISVKIERKNIVIRLPLEQPRPSSSGKSTLIATSRGLITGEAKYKNKPVVIVASAFIFPDKKTKPSKRKRKELLLLEEGIEEDVHHPCEDEQPYFDDEEDD